MVPIKTILLQLFEICCHLLPLSSKRVFFLSFAGQYNDNPKRISESLHAQRPDITLYWCISDKSKKNDIPDYVRIVKYGTFRSIYVKNRCKVVVENGAGFYLVNSTHKFIIKFKKLLKNRKQFDLATWHGNPIKHIGAQIPDGSIWTTDTVFSTADILLSGCLQVKEIFEKAFVNLMPVVLTGTPRTDILFNNSDTQKYALKTKLGLPVDKKVILYAPTYRYSPEDSGVSQLHMIDFSLLFANLSTKFGGEWVFVMRVHNMVLLELSKSGFLTQYNNVLYDGNQFDDMNEYLETCDVLLTDYSGCIYDVALTSKPCFLFAHDREYYVQKERGLYTPLAAFPYPFANSFEELLNCIMEYDYESSENKRIEFLAKIGNVEDGCAGQRVTDVILAKLKLKK